MKNEIFMEVAVLIVSTVIALGLIYGEIATRSAHCQEPTCSQLACFNDAQCGFYCKCFKVDQSKQRGQCLINY